MPENVRAVSSEHILYRCLIRQLEYMLYITRPHGDVSGTRSTCPKSPLARR